MENVKREICLLCRKEAYVVPLLMRENIFVCLACASKGIATYVDYYGSHTKEKRTRRANIRVNSQALEGIKQYCRALIK